MRTRLVSIVLVVGMLATSGVGIGLVGAEFASVDDPISDGSALAQTSNVGGSPDLDVYATNPNLIPGQTNQVEVTVANDGDFRFGPTSLAESVTTARGVRVEAEADGPISIESGETPIGTVTQSTPRSLPIAINVPDNIDPGTYTIDFDLSYTYFSSGDERKRTVDRELEVRVRDDARFQVVDVESDTQVGDSGTVKATIENVGSETARSADVTFTTQSSSVSVSGGQSDTIRVPEIGPGQTATVAYDVGVSPDLPVQQYTLSGTVTFDDPDGIRRTDQGLSIGVLPLTEQTFNLTNIESQLRVGEDGDLIGTVRNEGPLPARSVVVQYAGESQSVIPAERSTAVGTLEPGESSEFSLPISMSGEAEAGLRSLDMAVQYRNQDEELRAFEKLVVNADVAPERDRFAVTVENRTIQSGGSRTVEVSVTSNLNETASDVEARLFADDPLDTGETDTGYVQSIEPGETTTMTFELTATGSATPGSTYPISFDFRYDDSDGDSQLTDTFRLPVDVVEAEDGGLPIPVIIVVLLVVGTGGLVVYRRRQ
ncbi:MULTISPECIES: COG1361 S-layer family protein [unclassified Halorubrum]|uniref:COG1361 S-layer family protein n=1 Tax=unclassified Halorubrum TaxID=2642239 RepID=UPI001F5453D6|nr:MULTISPECIES: CARDB domain-containing protein [unclassified Halorubrum]